jgi:exosome complex component CSL4
MAATGADIVVPGDSLGLASEYISGAGTYVHGGHIRASALGSRVVEPSDSATAKAVISVVKRHATSSTAIVPSVNALVIGKVTRITQLAANIDILVLGGQPVDDPFNGVIRKEHVRDAEIDKVKIEDCFRPGDIVQAVVVSLGDARSYLLSTARKDLGVIYAASEAGDLMIPINFEEMEAPSTGAREKRKCAAPAL